MQYAKAIQHTKLIAAKRVQLVSERFAAMGHHDYQLQAQILKTALQPVPPNAKKLDNRFDLKRMAVEITKSKPKEQEDKDLTRRHLINKSNVSTNTQSQGIQATEQQRSDNHMQAYMYEKFVVNKTLYCPKDGKPWKKRPVPNPS